ncbi:uncharacterized protein B0H64DRAFT_402523, partial [Chaetomium fimeti]
MIRLRELHLDTGERNSPPAESPGSNLGGEEPDTTGLVAAVNREIESANVPVPVTVGITPPRATDDHTPEPTPGSNGPTDQETPPHQPEAKSNFSRFLDKIGLTSTTLGFIFAVILGAISWSGLNYANYYAKKSYDLALYQACRTYEDLQNSTACQTSLSTGIRVRSLPNIGPEIGSVAAYLGRAYMDALIAYLRACEDGVASVCFMRSSGPESSYSNFISSIPEIRFRLLWALLFRLLATIICRTGILHLERTSTPIRPQPSTRSLLDTFLGASISIFDCIFALETGALSGQISRMSAVSWASYFITTAALPILSATEGLNHLRTLLLSTSLVVLAPLSAEISDVAANAALAMTSMACFTLLPRHLRQPGSLHKEILQVEWTLQDGITMRRIGTLPDDTLEQGVVDQRDDGPQEAEFPGKKALRRRTKHNKMTLKTGDVAPERENTSTVEERVAKDSSPFLSVISACDSIVLNSAGLWLAYSLSGDLGSIAGEGFFCSYCLWRYTMLACTIKRIPQSFQENVIRGGGTIIEKIRVCEEAHKEDTIYSIWGLLISTVGICVASAKGSC